MACQVLAVLGCAAIGFLIRSAIQDDPRLGGAPTSAERSSSSFRLADAQTRKIPKDATLIATAKRPTILVRARPDGRRLGTLRRRTIEKQPVRLTFMVLDRRPGWVRVQLPTRPNGAAGWIRRRDVRLSSTRLRIRISLKRHRLQLLDAEHVVLGSKIGVGKAVSPTPDGRYFVTDVIRTPNPGGFYGPYSLGLSAYSPVYTTFRGGNGQVGIHGTNAPFALGSDVSHGCIRVRNDVVRRLATRVPLGTPVTITG